MENSWQSKCGLVWQQSSMHPLEGSSSHEFQNQRLSHPKLVVNSRQVPTNRSAAGSAMGRGVSLLPSWLWLQNMDSQNVKSGADFCPVISSSAMVSSNHANSSGLMLLQAAELNLRKSELARVVVCENPHETDLVKGSSSLGVDNPGATSANVLKLQNGANVVASQKVPLEIGFSGCSQPPNLPSGCPRVFCSGTSGDLCLSNTGLLGVVCLCHGLYMSISKFLEHSGLYNVNPANAVCMDNGDTIAHWRKTFFSKVGIRIPEDDKGWDWPEGFSAAPGLTNHFISNIPNNTGFFNEVCPVGMSGGSGQTQYHVTYLKDRHSGKNMVDGFQYNGKQGNSQECNSSLFKGFIGTSQSHLHHGDKMCPSNSVGTRGPDKASEPTTAKLDSILKSASPFYALPNFQNVKCSGKGSDVSRNISALKEGLSVSSNIELRLGQLPKHSQTLGSSAPLGFGLHLMGTQSGPQKSFLSDQLLHESLLNGNYRVSGVERPQQIADITSNTSERRETVQLNHVPGAYNAFVDYRIDSYNGGVGRDGSVIHPLFSCFKNPEAEVQFRNVNDIANGSHVVTEKSHSEPHASKCDQHCFPWSRVAGNIMESNATMLNAQKQVSKGQGGECAVNNLLAAAELNFGLHKPRKESLSTFNVVPEKGDITFSAFHEKCPTVSPRSSVINNEPNATDTLNNSWKISPLSHAGYSAIGYPRSINSTMNSGATISLTSSVCVESTTPALLKKNFSGVNPGILDENMKMLSVQNMLESPNRHATASVRNLQEPEMVNKRCAKPQVTVSPVISKDHMQVLMGTSVPKMSEVLKSSATCWRGLNGEKLALPTEGTFHAEDGGVPSQCSSNLHPMEKLFLRLGGNKRNITSSEQEVPFQGLPYVYTPEKCSYSVHAHCLAGKYDLKGSVFCDSLNDQEGIVNGRSKSLFRSMLDGNSIFSKEKAISFCDNENLLAENMETVQSRSFQNVPSGVLETSSSKRKHQQAGSFNSNGNVEDSGVDAAKCFTRSSQNAEPLKEQELSNVSSGCSAPVVTWVSIEVNRRDSSPVDTGDVRCTNDIVVDEGSRIDKNWSSDDSLDSEQSADFFGSAPRKRSSRSLIEELRFQDSLKLKKVQNETHASFSNQEESDHVPNFKKSKKMKKTVKWKKLDAAFPVSGQSSNNGSSKCTEDFVHNSNCVWDMQAPLGRKQKGPNNCSCSVEPSIKRRRSRWPSSNSVSSHGDLYRGYQVEQKIETRIHSRVDDDTYESPEILGKKRLKLDGAAATSKNLCRPCCDNAEVTANFTSVDCLSNSLDLPLDFYKWMARPVVFGKYGIISNGNSSKPAKIVPLWKILETTRKYDDKNVKAKSTSAKKLKRMSIRHVKETFRNKDVLKSEYHDASIVGKSGTHNLVTVEFEPHHSIGETETAPHRAITGNDELLHILEKRRNDNCSKNHSIPDSSFTFQLKTKYKEVRKRSLYELIDQGKDSEVTNSSIMKNPEYLLQTSHRRVGELMQNSEDDKFLYSEMHNAKRCRMRQLYESTQNLDALCCVCGSSNKNKSDQLLECNRCFIKVHQACYGISKVPKTQWYCRPCKTNSKNAVCVLCGYGEGAMTQALQSQNVVKSLLQAWNAVHESKINITMSTDHSGCQLSAMASGSDSFPVMRLAKSSSVSASNMNLSNRLGIVDNSSSPCNLMFQNSVTAGVLDSTVKQWVHVVCGLWTPGAHCRNVDTLNTFDVSDALSSKDNAVCSICSRPGGSCIQCWILDCSVCFHPWCAHQKGLLQTEAEGSDSENVGFYGRCMLHSTIQQLIPGSYPVSTESFHSGEKGLTSARTEGYKHQKHKGFWHKFSQESDRNGSCHVPQGQLNAWVHINRQKPHRKGYPKLPSSRVESDYRKEYARYKHSKGWKNLVVYKSDIHALGLYTSQFISQGAMVVEYVGEIVGLRVADKREREYHSGKKVQYKSACYFFRIDKEYIIDATRKGGIARFVNHSCKPNCVARVISGRNEKKVVFLAERDIYPGEEITYDYHFNYEDEGEKIPCYCNSKNCRRYLN
ncbi:isoform 2 of histone-lysine n-methyltransferase atx1 [Olea europaea subsp. europaea]|uniref:Isoform 2 of histone-lysine n-methyltransferase atx1 n=1 Tax=Olea europaea subsp. europaea TaxID=158383 RepID=A0A8S0UGA7_OLEEU|nr:isoform 2 of histone-lysine n-methyltransferase atx1 [Olea europaea subsp. europaea]